LLAALSSEELTEWIAYAQIDPFGSARSDLQAGIVASTMANIHAKQGHTFTPKDFMPVFDGSRARSKSMTPKEMLAKLKERFGKGMGRG